MRWDIDSGGPSRRRAQHARGCRAAAARPLLTCPLAARAAVAISTCTCRARGWRPTQVAPAVPCACTAAASSSSASAARSAHNASPRSAPAGLMRRTRAGATHVVPQKRAAVVVRHAARAALTSSGDGTRACSAARRRQKRANRPETSQFPACGSASAARTATAASGAPTARQRSHVTQWNTLALATLLRRTGVQRPAACRHGPRTLREGPTPAWRGLQRAGGASPAPPAQLACVTRRAAGSTSRAMRTANGRHVAIKAVRAHQRARCAPQRAAQQRCAANSQPVSKPPQRAASAANGRNARRCAPIGATHSLDASSALWDAAQPCQPLSPS